MKTSETDLTTMPSKTFYQGELGDAEYEKAINITYYTDCICLQQHNNGEVLITYPAFEALVKSIRKGIKP